MAITGKTGSIIKVDADPSVGGGLSAPLNAVVQFGSSLFIKTSAPDTGWVSSGGGGGGVLANNTYLQGNDTTPTVHNLIGINTFDEVEVGYAGTAQTNLFGGTSWTALGTGYFDLYSEDVGGSIDLYTENVVIHGRSTQTAAEKHSAIRAVSANTTLSATTDRTLLVDSSGGAVNVTLPVGQNGLEFIIKSVAAISTITIVPDGVETIDINSVAGTNFAASHIIFKSGAWWTIGSVP